MSTYYFDRIAQLSLEETRRWHPTLRAKVHKAVKELTPHEVAFETERQEKLDERLFNLHEMDNDSAEIILLVLSNRLEDPKLVLTQDELEFSRLRFSELLMIHQCLRQEVMVAEIGKHKVIYRILNSKPSTPPPAKRTKIKASMRSLRSRVWTGE